MTAYLDAIQFNLRNLARFSGRDGRRVFWPYAGTVIALFVLGILAVMLPEMSESMARMQRFAAENPDLATVRSGPGHYSITIEGHHPELMPDMGNMVGRIGVLFAIAILLLAAAVTRRLHDTGRSGAWGLMPVPFILFATVMMPRVFADPDAGLFLAVFFNNLLYLASLALLVLLLSRPGVETK